MREGITWKKPGVDWRITLKWVFKKWDGVWTGLIWLRVGTGSYECGNELSGFIKLGNFLISRGPVSFLGRTLLHGMRVSFVDVGSAVTDMAQPQPLLSAWISAACAMRAASTRVGNIR